MSRFFMVHCVFAQHVIYL